MSLQDIVADLHGATNALGVWLMLGIDVLAAAVRDPSVQRPRVGPHVCPDGEAWIEVGDVHVFAEQIGVVTLVFLFDDKSSLGLIRLRSRNARDAIVRELAPRTV